MKIFEKGSKKLTNAWAFYDWSNSVYPLVISTAIFPIYYSSLTDSFSDKNGDIYFMGSSWNPTSLYDYTLSFSFLIVAFFSPMLSAIADYTGNKLKFMKFFCTLGSISVMMLFNFTGEKSLYIGLIFTVLASIGFWGSLVFYNAYLPEVAYPQQQDRVSAKGFVFGYFGSVLLLIFCLIMIENPELFNISDPTLPTRISFLLVGVWWLGFSQLTFRRLPNNIFNLKPEKDYIWKGFIELKAVYKQLVHYPSLKRFLFAFFFFSIGVQTIVLMAGIFGSKELGLPTSNLILTIILVQLAAIIGAYFFSKLSEKYGNIFALRLSLFIWGVVCFIAFTLDKNQAGVHTYFYIMGGVLGLVLGATQSLGRSTYSKLLPETHDHAIFFSFYDVTEKIAIVIGMFIFGFLIALTGSMQYSVLCLSIFFGISFFVLSSLNKSDIPST